MNYKYGLNPAPKPPELRFGSYLMEAQLPPIPQTFGRASLYYPTTWGMLGNNVLGDCTIAGAMHAVMCWNKIVGKRIIFTNLDAQDDYYALTGGQDTGLDIVTVADYWRKTGMRDASNQRHKIGAYLAGNIQNFDHLYAGCYLLGPVGLGVNIPVSAGQQFDNAEPWSIVPGSRDDGYHYVPLIDRVENGNALVVTWGRQQEVEQAWLAKYLQEVVFYVSQEDLVDGKSPQGFAMADLLDDLQVISS